MSERTVVASPTLQHFVTLLNHRRAADGLVAWEPHAKQRAFMNAVLHGECLENYAFWANRAGKTLMGAACGSVLARFGADPQRPALGAHTVVWDRATQGWVVGLDYRVSRDVIQPKYFANGFGLPGDQPFIPAEDVAEWRVGDQVLKLKNGSIIGFKSAEAGAKKMQGIALDWVHFDEEPEQSVFSEATIRIGGGERPLRIFCTCTLLPPEGQSGGVSWMFPQIIQPWKEGALDVGIFQAAIYDNPYLQRAEIARLESRYPLGSTERRIRLNGELLPGVGGSLAYAAFNRQLHVQRLPELSNRRALCWCWDFNVSPMVSLVGQRIDGVFQVHDELILDTGSIPQMVTLFKERYPSHGAEIWLYGDATGHSRDSQTAKSDYQLILDGMRDYSSPVVMKIPEANPFQRDRINAMNRSLLDEQGLVGVLIAPRCRELIADMEGVLRDPRGGILKTYDRKNPYARRTHTSDALGCWVHHERPVREESTATRQSRVTTVKQVSYGRH